LPILNPETPGGPPGVPPDSGAIPEPATLALLALGAGAWLARRSSRGDV
jgi:hypothetical protein